MIRDDGGLCQPLRRVPRWLDQKDVPTQAFFGEGFHTLSDEGVDAHDRGTG